MTKEGHKTRKNVLRNKIQTFNEANTVASRVAITFKQASNLRGFSTSPKSSSNALSWSVIKACINGTSVDKYFQFLLNCYNKRQSIWWDAGKKYNPKCLCQQSTQSS